MMSENRNLKLLAQAPIGKALMKLGIPTMIGMMVSALYNVVDAYFVGTLGTSQQAAVSAVFPVSLLMLGIGLLFGCGAGSYISRLLGKGDRKEADRCASTALALAVGTGLVLVILMLAALNPLLHLLGCTETMMPYARAYAVPFIIGLVINVFNATMSNIATAEGAPVYSMRSMLIGGIANIILDPVCISILGMGVYGAAFATLIARLLSLGSYLLFLFQKKSSLHFSFRFIRPDRKLLFEIAQIGVPACLYQALLSVALTITNNLAAPYGDSAVAAAGIVSRIITLGIMTIMGFCKGYQTLVGFNYGAGNYKRVREATHTALRWTTIFCVVCCAVLLLFRTPLILAFSPDDPQVLSIGSRILALTAITFLTLGYQIVYSTKFMGMGCGLEGGLISMGRQGIFFIPAIYTLTAVWGLNGLILSQPVADILSMLLVVVLARKNEKAESRLIDEQMAIDGNTVKKPVEI